jgi:low affinity Fe/Cu permease
MNNGKTVGMVLFVGGIIILIAYGLFLGFQNIESIDYIIAIGAGAIIIGILTLLISIIIEQREDTKKMKEEISKEDLEP